MERCTWSEKDDLYRQYHDTEWGKPVYDDAILFEFLVLETFQAGLSWYTILKKRENFRQAFDQFDAGKIADYPVEKELELLQNEGIIRNKLKVKATISNAVAFLKVQEEFGSFSDYIWKFVDGKPILNKPRTLADVSATTKLSDAFSKDLKKRGFKFVGSTVVYAFMQAVGLVNDHVATCFLYHEA
jgi:DNA-3-methyladenine glycosylase I